MLFSHKGICVAKSKYFSLYFYIMKGKQKKKTITFEEKVLNAEKILQGKELNPNGKELFEKTLKKATTTKQHGSK